MKLRPFQFPDSRVTGASPARPSVSARRPSPWPTGWPRSPGTVSSPENRPHGDSDRLGAGCAESEAAGSRVTHELDPRRGRSTPGFALSREELDIAAVEDRAGRLGGEARHSTGLPAGEHGTTQDGSGKSAEGSRPIGSQWAGINRRGDRRERTGALQAPPPLRRRARSATGRGFSGLAEVRRRPEDTDSTQRKAESRCTHE